MFRFAETYVFNEEGPKDRQKERQRHRMGQTGRQTLQTDTNVHVHI